jgi:hypothetical protein
MHSPLHRIVANQRGWNQEEDLVLRPTEGIEHRVLPHAGVDILTVQREGVGRDALLGRGAFGSVVLVGDSRAGWRLWYEGWQRTEVAPPSHVSVRERMLVIAVS